MKIAPHLFSIANSVVTPRTIKTNKNAQITLKQPLFRDVVSFKADFERDVNCKGVQLYRSISESEYKSLMRGDVMNKGYNYATSDPRGWGARDWNSGYRFNYREPVYFVTFKPEISSEIMDRRDSSRDTRYSLDEYTLKDVESVRKGTNAHGELVYSENFEEDLIKDRIEKMDIINSCKKVIQDKSSDKDKEVAWDVLTSYAEEFPDVIDEFDCDSEHDFNNQTYINGLLSYVNKANNPKYLDIARQCINIQILNSDINVINNATALLGEKGDKSDIVLITALEKKGKLSPYCAANDLNKLIKDDLSDENLISSLKTDKNSDLLTLVLFFEKRNKDNKYNYVFRDVLKHCVEKGFKSTQYDSKLMSVVEVCAKQLENEANPENIECLKHFYDPQRLNYYPDMEVYMAILKIENKIMAGGQNK